MANLGFIAVPYLPAPIQLVDRDDGRIWLLTHRSSDTRVGIRDTALARHFQGQVRRYGAFDGPVLGRYHRIRLLVRGGRLGYEVLPRVQGLSDQDNARVLTWRDGVAYSLELWEDGWGKDGDTLGYKTVVVG